MDKNKQAQYMIRRIGGTTYKVRVAFSESGKETMEDKILRMIRNEVARENLMNISMKKYSLYLNFLVPE